MIRYVGCDGNGIPRVWGEGRTRDEAIAQVEQAANKYVKRRPDLADDVWFYKRDYQSPA